MMTFKKFATVFGCSALVWASPCAATAEEAAVDAELAETVAYVEALVSGGYPDFAAPVIEEAKKRWPASEAQLFAIEVRGLLSLGKFEDAERRIAELPDRKGTKFWAARLEVANNYYARNMKPECMKIYDEFFAAFPKPPKDIAKFHMEASYMYGQLLFADQDYEKAAKIYEGLLPQVKREDWCNLAAETAKTYMKHADKLGKGRNEAALKAAEKIVDRLLWKMDEPVFFGQAVSMKAHIEVMRGKVDRAQAILEEYKPNLQEIHDQIVENDPEGTKGLLKLSPLPECLYLQAQILFDAAKEEFKKPKRNDEQVKAYLFGAQDKSSGRRDGKGAFNFAVNLFVRYDWSPWAPQAGDLMEEIRLFAEKNYGAKIKTTITPEQIAKARTAQFKKANELFLADQYQACIDEYQDLLRRYPELPESVDAVAHMASALLDLYTEEKDPAQKELYRLDCDAVEAYLAERFAGHRDRMVMIAGGNAAYAAAAKEQERGDLGRADRLYAEFYTNYREHPNAATLAAGKAGEAQKEGRWDDAIARWQVIENCYSNSPFYASALAQLSFCYGKTGDEARQIAYMNRNLEVEKSPVRRLQGRMQLAQMYQKSGLATLTNIAETATAEEVSAAERAGSASIIRAIKQFVQFSEETKKAIDDPSTPKADREKFVELREAAMFLVGECYSRITRPEKALAAMRARAAESFEAYAAAYPDGKYVRTAYVKLGMIYTAMGDLVKSKDALDRLSRDFPDSDEAKSAKPRLARSLIEIGMRKEGTEIYAEMLRTDGKYTAGQFLNAGDALIEAHSWSLANQAFEKAARLAGTNQTAVVAKARLGLARTSFKQGSFAEAREALDLFLADPKMSRMQIAVDAYFMMIEIASEQGRKETDPALRAKYFNTAVGALKKVRVYWAKRPAWEQDQLDLMGGDILLRRLKAEQEMNLGEEQIAETRGRAASTFLTFIQSKGPTEARPIGKFAAEELANLETAYARAIALWLKMGEAGAEFVVRYGEEYRRYFPNGKNRTEVLNAVNAARVTLPAAGAAPEAAAEPKAETINEE